MSGGPCKSKIGAIWTPPPVGIFKFNEDGKDRGKPGLTGIRGFLGDANGTSSMVFFESTGR